MKKPKKLSAEDEAVSAVKAPSTNQLSLLSKKINEAVALEERIANGQALLKELNEQYQALTVSVIPDLMLSAGVDSFKLKDGTKVGIKDFVNGSLPKDEANRKAALAWIIDAGAQDLIKEEIDMAFPRGSAKDAERVKAALKKLKVDFTAKEGIHPQTLYAFVRERLKNGEKVPLELLGVHVGRVAKIEPAGEKG